ncbi:hypothetical protein [Thermosipho atlanticus]|uniref:Uncharacterized protein n=1 Tax=Thermosipho atlanticus DSM 15807 TaxID=1123380 RepID=A0A1M5RM37_9BACT|nr:hypothetical protein [Thermosipho atlanticus]SHH27382.1 hypothetical protein SAMN02745199_0501 [Thermosipho atlanticus DSM 15807]
MPLKKYITPSFIDNNKILPKLANIQKDIKQDNDICKKVMATIHYNILVEDGSLKNYLCDFLCEKNCKFKEIIKDGLGNGYSKIGLKRIMSFEVDSGLFKTLEAFIEAIEISMDNPQKFHGNMEFAYNLVLGKLLLLEFESYNIKLYANVTIEPVNKVKFDSLELDIALIDESSKKVLAIESTSHSDRDNSQWYEHFQKKSAQSLLLYNEAFGVEEKWDFKLIYFYLHRFNFDKKGAFNIYEVDDNTFFVPIQMWDFSDFSKLSYIWNSNEEQITKYINIKLDKIKNGLIQKIFSFFK